MTLIERESGLRVQRNGPVLTIAVVGLNGLMFVRAGTLIHRAQIANASAATTSTAPMTTPYGPSNGGSSFRARSQPRMRKARKINGGGAMTPARSFSSGISVILVVSTAS